MINYFICLIKLQSKVGICIAVFFLTTSNFVFGQYELQDAFPNLSFNNPVFLTHADDNTNRVFVVEQGGKIKVFPNDQSASNAKVFLDLSDKVYFSGEMGLLGLAFHPDYVNNGYFYVYYSVTNPFRSVISRFKVTSNPDSADKNSEYQILTFNKVYENHNGGWMSFRKTDGYLYISTGDGGSGGDPQNNAQNINVFLGKILRIDVDGGTPYAIPPTNPFYDSTNTSIKKEIYAWGLRNPWRNSFDPVTDWFWCADVGQYEWEEINLIENGKNYGWRCYEGNHPYNTSGCNYPDYTYPIFEYSHGDGCSITGG
ncbi:MAG TPA: PQQ-dependent sugar dehydrogenase, partial [Ignavibacteriaceae bacterium]|nr:PQQ-dependent sugar dehydrogenase [Ignavibacteriaceae bacterium]